jgi:hypothetical protein
MEDTERLRSCLEGDLKTYGGFAPTGCFLGGDEIVGGGSAKGGLGIAAMIEEIRRFRLLLPGDCTGGLRVKGGGSMRGGSSGKGLRVSGVMMGCG